MCRHSKWINLSLKIALKSDVEHYRHGSVLIKGGSVISTGYNKNEFGCVADSCYELKGWHSELDCLFNIHEEAIEGAVLYVGGWSKGRQVVYSKPCKHCQRYLSKHKLKAIYYSTPNMKYERLTI